MAKKPDWQFRMWRSFWDRSDLCLQEKAIVAILRSRSNNSNCCWPTKPQLAKAAQISERTVGEYLRSLSRKGVIKISTFRDQYGHVRNHYTILHPIVTNPHEGNGENGLNPIVTKRGGGHRDDSSR